MKKIAAAVLALALALGFAACSSGDKAGYQDGTYRAEDAEYSHGYKEFVEITIKGGKIDNVDYNALKEDNTTLKTTDEEYKKSYEGTGNDATPDVFYPSLAQQLMKTKNVDKVETVVGATNSSNNFKKLAAAALEKAKAGDTATALVAGESGEGAE